MITEGEALAKGKQTSAEDYGTLYVQGCGLDCRSPPVASQTAEDDSGRADSPIISGLDLAPRPLVHCAMAEPETRSLSQADRLLEVIRIQTDIARLGLDLDGVLSLVADRARRMTAADGAVLQLLEDDELVSRAAVGSEARQIGMRMSSAGSISAVCASTGEAVRVDDATTDDRVDRDACARVGLRSLMCVPLRHGGSVAGVLKVTSKTASSFGDSEAQLLTLLAGLVDAAMYGAEGYEGAELFQRATLDPLTGLSNKALFHDRLRYSLAQGRRNAHNVGIFIIDVSALQSINEEHGHRAGDAVLAETASRILYSARTSDTVARLGPHEFGVILSRVDGADGVVVAHQRLLDLLHLPFQFEDVILSVSANIGSALFPEDGESMDQLMEIARLGLGRGAQADQG